MSYKTSKLQHSIHEDLPSIFAGKFNRKIADGVNFWKGLRWNHQDEKKRDAVLKK